MCNISNVCAGGRGGVNPNRQRALPSNAILILLFADYNAFRVIRNNENTCVRSCGIEAAGAAFAYDGFKKTPISPFAD